MGLQSRRTHSDRECLKAAKFIEIIRGCLRLCIPAKAQPHQLFFHHFSRFRTALHAIHTASLLEKTTLEVGGAARLPGSDLMHAESSFRNAKFDGKSSVRGTKAVVI